MKSKKANLKKEVKGPMKMKRGGYLEPDKELMFGGKSKYQKGGKTPTSIMAENQNRELYSYLTVLEKMSNMSPNEKTKLAQQRQRAAANKGKQSPTSTTPKNNPPRAASAREAEMVAKMAARDIQSPKVSAAPAPKSQTGSADYPRGGIGTPISGSGSAAPAPKLAAGSGSAASKPQPKGSTSFNQAFAAARKEGKTTFTWNGKSYGTRRADETQEQYKAAMARAAGSATPASKPASAPKAPAAEAPRPTAPVPMPSKTPVRPTPQIVRRSTEKIASAVPTSDMKEATKDFKGDKKQKSMKKMGGYLEPDKELMFGGKSKYQAGGMAPTPMKPKKKMEMPASMQTPAKKKKPMGLMGKMQDAMGKSKYKSGGFPDLTGDGKITKADILKGRGVIKEAGGMMEECGPGRPCYNAKKAARTARRQERDRRNPNAARRRAANSGRGGGGAGVGGALKTVAGLGALGFMAKKAKDSM